MTAAPVTTTGYEIRECRPGDVRGARQVMLDTFYRVFGTGYVPEHHDDVVDIEGTYLGHPLNRLWVAAQGERIVATTAIRARGPRTPPHPRWLVERYPDETTAQLFRVYVQPEHHRRGLASRLVRAAVDHVESEHRFHDLYLHTDPGVPGALEFWKTFGTVIHDPREPGSDYRTVHLAIALDRTPVAAG